MARKSRKNMMPQAAVQEAVQQNEKELLRTAAYARLSVENGGHETEDSLHTQILQIHNYIRENPDLTLTDTYADNGFTGTRFDRPEFERMMQDVPKADVVITNPTHFAVALKYEAKVSSAPVVLAKGEDYLAQKIKEVARENKIEIVENKPLARMLYHNVDVGAEIPPELYQAVAEVLAAVYKAKNIQ